MTTIIALHGSSNSGKTTVLKELCKKFLDEKSITKCRTIIYKRESDWLPKTKITIPKTGDISLILESNNTKNPINIGIATGGNKKAIVESNLKFFNENNCSIIVCATKVSGETVESIHTLLNKNKTIKLIPIYKAKNFHNHDRNLTKELYDIINKYTLTLNDC